MKGTYKNNVYYFHFINQEDEIKKAKVTSASLYGAKLKFNSRYKGKVKEFITIEEADK